MSLIIFHGAGLYTVGVLKDKLHSSGIALQVNEKRTIIYNSSNMRTVLQSFGLLRDMASKVDRSFLLSSLEWGCYAFAACFFQECRYEIFLCDILINEIVISEIFAPW